MKSQYLQIFISGSVGCGTELTLFYHSEFILFIEIHSQNTRTEDGQINIPRCILYHFTNVGEFVLFINLLVN
jgi:hypothetical protein